MLFTTQMSTTIDATPCVPNEINFITAFNAKKNNEIVLIRRMSCQTTGQIKAKYHCQECNKLSFDNQQIF